MRGVKNNTTRIDFIATVTLLVLLSLAVIFHFLILLKILPFEFIWGGRLKNDSGMFLLEALSVLVNLVILIVVAIHAGMIKTNISKVIIKIALWMIFVLFLFNTLGNYFSQNKFERVVFTPVTLVLSILFLILALDKKHIKHNE